MSWFLVGKVYWVGGFIGAGLAAVIYEYTFMERVEARPTQVPSLQVGCLHLHHSQINTCSGRRRTQEERYINNLHKVILAMNWDLLCHWRCKLWLGLIARGLGTIVQLDLVR